MDRRSGLFTIFASLLPERTPPTVITADPPRSPVRHRLTGITGLIGQEPMPKLWVIVVGIEQRVRPMRLHDLAGRGGLRQPSVAGLAGKPQYPFPRALRF